MDELKRDMETLKSTANNNSTVQASRRFLYKYDVTIIFTISR